MDPRPSTSSQVMDREISTTPPDMQPGPSTTPPDMQPGPSTTPSVKEVGPTLLSDSDMEVEVIGEQAYRHQLVNRRACSTQTALSNIGAPILLEGDDLRTSQFNYCELIGKWRQDSQDRMCQMQQEVLEERRQCIREVQEQKENAKLLNEKLNEALEKIERLKQELMEEKIKASGAKASASRSSPVPEARASTSRTSPAPVATASTSRSYLTAKVKEEPNMLDIDNETFKCVMNRYKRPCPQSFSYEQDSPPPLLAEPHLGTALPWPARRFYHSSMQTDAVITSDFSSQTTIEYSYEEIIVCDPLRDGRKDDDDSDDPDDDTYEMPSSEDSESDEDEMTDEVTESDDSNSPQKKEFKVKEVYASQRMTDEIPESDDSNSPQRKEYEVKEVYASQRPGSSCSTSQEMQESPSSPTSEIQESPSSPTSEIQESPSSPTSEIQESPSSPTSELQESASSPTSEIQESASSPTSAAFFQSTIKLILPAFQKNFLKLLRWYFPRWHFQNWRTLGRQFILSTFDVTDAYMAIPGASPAVAVTHYLRIRTLHTHIARLEHPNTEENVSLIENAFIDLFNHYTALLLNKMESGSYQGLDLSFLHLGIAYDRLLVAAKQQRYLNAVPFDFTREPDVVRLDPVTGEAHDAAEDYWRLPALENITAIFREAYETNLSPLYNYMGQEQELLTSQILTFMLDYFKEHE